MSITMEPHDPEEVEQPQVGPSTHVYDVVDRWIRDRRFRVELRDDPAAAVRKMGLELSDGQWAGLRHLVIG
jgi:hypothetical protein